MNDIGRIFQKSADIQEFLRLPKYDLYKKSGLNIENIAKKHGLSHLALYEVKGNDIKLIQGVNENKTIISPASTIKLAVASAIMEAIKKRKIKLDDELIVSDKTKSDGEKLTGKKTVRELLKLMLQESNNTATNMLVEALGGPGDPINKQFKSLGFNSIKFHRYLSQERNKSPKKNEASVHDLAKSMAYISSYNNGDVKNLVSGSLRNTTYNHQVPGEMLGKAGYISNREGYVSYVEIEGKKFIVAGYITEEPFAGKRSRMRNAIHEVVKKIKA